MPFAIRKAVASAPLQIPSDLAGAYGVNQSDIRFIARVQNYIFAYQRNGAEFILRLTPRTHKSAEQVKAEVEWVNDLSTRGVSVAAVVPQADGALSRITEIAGELFKAE